MTHVLPLAVSLVPTESLNCLGRGIFCHKNIHTLTFIHIFFCLNSRLCWTWREAKSSKNWWLAHTIHMYALAKPELCLNHFFSLNQHNETWLSNCQLCGCNAETMNVTCNPLNNCTESQTPNCSETGQVLVNTTDGCCTVQKCGEF